MPAWQGHRHSPGSPPQPPFGRLDLGERYFDKRELSQDEGTLVRHAVLPAGDERDALATVGLPQHPGGVHPAGAQPARSRRVVRGEASDAVTRTALRVAPVGVVLAGASFSQWSWQYSAEGPCLGAVAGGAWATPRTRSSSACDAERRALIAMSPHRGMSVRQAAANVWNAARARARSVGPQRASNMSPVDRQWSHTSSLSSTVCQSMTVPSNSVSLSAGRGRLFDDLPTLGRWGLILLLSALAVWLTPVGGQLAFAGVVLGEAVVGGFFVKRGRNAWYAIGVLAVLWGLWLGLAPADSGPYSMASTGYGCGSVFAPAEEPISEDAPPYLARQRRAVAAERGPFVVLILGLGAYALVWACRSQATTGTEAEAPRDAVRA